MKRTGGEGTGEAAQTGGTHGDDHSKVTSAVGKQQ